MNYAQVNYMESSSINRKSNTNLHFTIDLEMN